MNRRDRRAERKAGGGRTAAGASTPSVDQLFKTALKHHQAGELAEAEQLYLQILAIDKDHIQGIHHIGLVAHQLGHHARAAVLIGRAILLNERVPEFHYNLALVLQALGRLDDAVWHNERALALKPDYADAHNNLGTVLLAKGQHAAAAARHRQALALNPEMTEAHFSLGNACLAQRQWDQAIDSYRQTLSRAPNHAEAHDKIGTALKALGKLDEAEAHFQLAQALNRNLIDALNQSAETLIADGKAGQALPSIRRALSIQETARTKHLFAECMRSLGTGPTDSDFRALLVRAISEAWDRPYKFVIAAFALVKDNKIVGECIKRAYDVWPRRPPAQELFGPFGLATIAKDELLRCLLTTGPNRSMELERFLTSARHALLEVATAEASVPPDDRVLGFYSALAQQCFINEYVFTYTDEEISRARALRDSLCAALEAGTPVSPLWPVAVAAYFPLNALPAAQSLVDRTWPDAVISLLVQQVHEPAEERQYRPTITRLTAIADDVSTQVQQQYQENPYPRWTTAQFLGTPTTFDASLRRMLPTATFQPVDDENGIDILSAGCGTGRPAIESARPILGARVLAIDLSLDSLCYAARMARQLGIDNIEFAQADILALGSIGRTFDVIEVSGVLHHLADPLAGWHVLLSLLRPGGVMNVGLYSELARTDVRATQVYLAERGYGSSADDIRRARQELMSSDVSPQLQKMAWMGDFYATSEFRDLLLHVQEHRFKIPQIAKFLAENDLDFLGFFIGREVLRLYTVRFPDDPSRTNLDYWHVFETENPSTFIGMYQFWIQKKRLPNAANL